MLLSKHNQSRDLEGVGVIQEGMGEGCGQGTASAKAGGRKLGCERGRRKGGVAGAERTKGE